MNMIRYNCNELSVSSFKPHPYLSLLYCVAFIQRQVRQPVGLVPPKLLATWLKIEFESADSIQCFDSKVPPEFASKRHGITHQSLQSCLWWAHTCPESFDRSCDVSFDLIASAQHPYRVHAPARHVAVGKDSTGVVGSSTNRYSRCHRSFEHISIHFA